jgi:hypothetical protein
MPKHKTSLRYIVAAATTAAALWLPIPSVARADQPADATTHPKKHGATIPHQQQSQSKIRPRIYNAAPSLPAGCTWPYQNQFPPCQSTWPAGDPNYHGSRPGVTFEN